MTIRILLSYRRSDSAAMTGRIFDRLVQQFGRKSVFLDVDSIPFGTDFRTHIDGEMRVSNVLVAIIGAEWLGARDGIAPTRITDEQDPIRAEIASALKLKVPIIPVLVNNATMPAAEQLPEEIAPLSYINALEISSGRDFHPHMDRLIQSIDKISLQKRRGSFSGLSPKIWLSAASLALMAASILAVVSWPDLFRATLRGSLPNLQAPKTDFCTVLKSVLANADKGFVDLVHKDPDGSSNNVTLPGFTYCSVQKLNTTTYVCEAGETLDKTEADAALKRNADQIKTCLTGGWAGPNPLLEAWSFYKSETGDNIILMNTPKTTPANAKSYSPSFMAYRNIQNVEHVSPIEDVKVPNDFCPDLTKVIASAAGSFEDIKGLDQGGYWLSKLSLKGFAKCDINPFSEAVPNRRYYGCKLQPFSSVIAAKLALNELADKTAACLTGSWPGESDLDLHNRPRWTFQSPTAPLDVELRITPSLNEYWRINIDVNMRSQK